LIFILCMQQYHTLEKSKLLTDITKTFWNDLFYFFLFFRMLILESATWRWHLPDARPLTLHPLSWPWESVYCFLSLPHHLPIFSHFCLHFPWMCGSTWDLLICSFLRCFSHWLEWRLTIGKIHIPARSPKRWRTYGLLWTPHGQSEEPPHSRENTHVGTSVNVIRRMEIYQFRTFLKPNINKVIY